MRNLLGIVGICMLCSTAANASVASTKSAVCSSEKYGQHTMTLDASTVNIHGERYEIRSTRKLANGTNLFIFSTRGSNPTLLGMNPQPDGSTLYMISDMQKNTLDTGMCK